LQHSPATFGQHLPKGPTCPDRAAVRRRTLLCGSIPGAAAGDHFSAAIAVARQCRHNSGPVRRILVVRPRRRRRNGLHREHHGREGASAGGACRDGQTGARRPANRPGAKAAWPSRPRPAGPAAQARRRRRLFCEGCEQSFQQPAGQRGAGVGQGVNLPEHEVPVGRCRACRAPRSFDLGPGFIRYLRAQLEDFLHPRFRC